MLGSIRWYIEGGIVHLECKPPACKVDWLFVISGSIVSAIIHSELHRFIPIIIRENKLPRLKNAIKNERPITGRLDRQRHLGMIHHRIDPAKLSLVDLHLLQVLVLVEQVVQAIVERVLRHCYGLVESSSRGLKRRLEAFAFFRCHVCSGVDISKGELKDVHG